MCKKSDNDLLLDLELFIYKKSKELEIDHIGICCISDYEKLEKKYKSDNLIPIKKVFPECKTIISAALSYNFSWNCIDEEIPGYIARYTVCNFYKILKKKLKLLADQIHFTFFPKLEKKRLYSIFVNSKIDDKLCAYASGIGKFAKNSLITTESGNRVVLGEILLSVDFNIHFHLKDKIDSIDYCKNCNICIKSCPTKALTLYKVKKEKCLQYLSTLDKWPDDNDYIKIWGKRFFGCTKCLDVCPLNNKNKKNQDIHKEGFVGFFIDPNEILKFTKEDFLIKFNNNQLGAKWVKPYVLVRNALVALYNMKNFRAIEEYYQSIEKYNWDKNETEYLRNFASFLLNLCNKKLQ